MNHEAYLRNRSVTGLSKLFVPGICANTLREEVGFGNGQARKGTVSPLVERKTQASQS
jgi:hypothetical protein